MRSNRSFTTMLIPCFLVFAFAFSFSPTVSLAATAEKPIVWKVQGFVPAGMLYHDHLLHLAKTVKELSGGRLVFDVHPVGAIVPTLEGLKATSDGVLDAHYDYPAMWMGKIPASALFTSVPGGFETFDFLMWLDYGGGKKLWQDMYDKYRYNVKVFVTGAMSMQIYQWSKKPLRTLEDMKGVKMRMMPLMGDVLKARGFSVAFLPAAEILPALERGVIDAAEYATPAFDYTAGYHKVCKYYSYPGVHQPAAIYELIVNKKSYEALPEDLKLVLDKATYQETFWTWQHEEYLSIKALEEFEKNGNVLVMMDDETVQTKIKWSREYLDSEAEKDAFFKEVWESMKSWEGKWYPYLKMNRMERE